MKIDANSSDLWNHRYHKEPRRDCEVDPVYRRILELLPPASRVIDFGGGVGRFGLFLQQAGHRPLVTDHSSVAVAECQRKGLEAQVVDLHVPLETQLVFPGGPVDAYATLTEVLEHFNSVARSLILRDVRRLGFRGVFVSVPNDRLGPDVTRQHHVKYTEASLRRDLVAVFGLSVRVEAHGPVMKGGKPSNLLGVCGELL